MEQRCRYGLGIGGDVPRIAGGDSGSGGVDAERMRQTGDGDARLAGQCVDRRRPR